MPAVVTPVKHRCVAHFNYGTRPEAKGVRPYTLHLIASTFTAVQVCDARMLPQALLLVTIKNK